MRNHRLFCLLFALLAAAASASSFKDEKLYGQDALRQMIKWFEVAARDRGATHCSVTMTKRNSEIINSLLGLPKNLNDVGKKSSF